MNTILHVDMDAFYASVEQRDQPELMGKPVIVGGRPESRGVVAACSYEAREFGVHSAMPCGQALKRCPDAIFLPVRMARYQEVSEQVMAIFDSFTPLVEKLSIDEAFLDVTGTQYLYPDSTVLARELKQRVKNALQLNASVGLAKNKFLAKLASDLDKPDGLTIVPEGQGELLQFLSPLPVERIWGVGKVLERRLHNAGIRTFGDIHRMTKSGVQRIPGNSMGEMLWNLAHGVDHRDLNTSRVEKSISSETTFAKDVSDPDVLRSIVVQQAEEAGRRLRASKHHAGTVQLKVRYEDFKTITRQVSVKPPTQSDADIIHHALKLFDKINLEQGVRLTGVGVAKLCDPDAVMPGEQLSLFDAPAVRESPEDAALDQAVDALREKYGKGALKRGERKR
jgi:DNA polymerase-4